MRSDTVHALKELSMIFLVIVDREKKIEIRKEVLISIKAFNPYQLFTRLSS